MINIKNYINKIKNYINITKWEVKSIIQENFGKYHGFDKFTKKTNKAINLKNEEEKKEINVLLYTNTCGSMFWVNYFTVISLILAKIGYKVVFIWNDDPITMENENTNTKEFRKWSSTWKFKNQKNYEMIIWSLNETEKVCQINEFKNLDIKEISKMDACQQCKVEEYSPEIEKVNVIYEYRNKINLMFCKKMKEILNKTNFNLIISVNGAVHEMAVLTQLAKVNNLNIINLEIAEKNNDFVIAKNAPAWDFWLEKNWEKNSKKNNDDRNIAFFKNNTALRSSGIKEEDYSVAFQLKPKVLSNDLINNLNINKNLKNVLMCTNVAWDSAVLKQGVSFNTQREWIIETIKYFEKNEKINLIIRIHPAEKMIDTNEPVMDCIKNNFKKLPKNVIVIGPESEINTYSLVDIANYGLVFSSSIGLEMVCSGIPVIVSARVHYGDRGFTIFPKNKKEYFEKVAEMISNQDTILGHKEKHESLDYYWYYYNMEFLKIPLQWGQGYNFDFKNNENWIKLKSFCGNLVDKYI